MTLLAFLGHWDLKFYAIKSCCIKENICNFQTDLMLSLRLLGSYSFWLTKSAFLPQQLRKPHWTRCSSSRESQSAEWLMETADQGSTFSTIATLGSRRRTECIESQAHTHKNTLQIQEYQHTDVHTSLTAFIFTWRKNRLQDEV